MHLDAILDRDFHLDSLVHLVSLRRKEILIDRKICIEIIGRIIGDLE